MSGALEMRQEAIEDFIAERARELISDMDAEEIDEIWSIVDCVSACGRLNTNQTSLK